MFPKLHTLRVVKSPLMRFARKLCPIDHGSARVAPEARELDTFDHRLRRMMSSARKLCLLDHGLAHTRLNPTSSACLTVCEGGGARSRCI